MKKKEKKSFTLNDNNQLTECVCVLLKNYRLLCCFHLGWSDIPFSPSHLNHSITADGSKCPFSTQDKGRGLVYTKSIFTLQDQSPALLP